MNNKDIGSSHFHCLLGSFITGNLTDSCLRSELISELDRLLPNNFYIAVSFRLSISDWKTITNQTAIADLTSTTTWLIDDNVKSIKMFLDFLEKKSDIPFIIFKTGLSSAIIFFNPETDVFDIKPNLSEIHNWILERFDFESFWGISSCISDLMLLPELAQEAVNATGSTHLAHINSSFLPTGSIEEITTQDRIYYPRELENLIVLSIKSYDIARLDFLLQILKDENCIFRSISNTSLLTLNSKIAETIKRFNNTINNFDSYIEKLTLCISSGKGHDHYFDALSEMLNEICFALNRKKAIQKNALVSEIKEYLLANFRDDNLSLANTASLFELSEGYLSSIFKEQTATSFTDYVELLRINEACRLLSETEESINDIALKSGYNNVYSFRRAFKRSHMISPKEFRFRGIFERTNDT